jgi:hypothetical protein
MRVIRNIYFWLILGSIAFIVLMNWSASKHISQKHLNEIAAERDEVAPVAIGPFGMGFVTACIIGGAWVVVYRQKHPKPSGELRGSVMDYETGELHENDVVDSRHRGP